MRLVRALAIAVGLACLVPAIPGVFGQMDVDRVVPGGGIFAAGWTGKIDASSVKAGRTINDSKFALEGSDLHLIIGPAAVYWNPANTASGNYTVKGSFKEPKYQDANSHPHPYGLFIGGSKMGTDAMSLVYCTAYGNGTFIVRGFTGTAPGTFRVGGNAPTANAAIHKAAAPGETVTQDIQWTVKDGKATCSINGTAVGTYDKADLVAAGKLDSLDGVYGIRISHNVEAIVSGFGMTKQ